MKDLTRSNIQRQNILNNKYALKRISEYIGLSYNLLPTLMSVTKLLFWDFLILEHF